MSMRVIYIIFQSIRIGIIKLSDIYIIANIER